MLERPDLIPGEYYILEEFPEYGPVLFTNDYGDRQAPLRFTKEPRILGEYGQHAQGP